nr:methyltransferase domain-containing protein [uncultured Rhodoferax sp.]
MARAALMRLQGMLAGKAKSFQPNQDLFLDKSGIEIGGPSAVFSAGGIFPVYPLIRNLENINFSSITAWDEGPRKAALFGLYRLRGGIKQHLGEATSMPEFATGAYDFVLSSHMLEHTTNPIKALMEWKRLLKDNGALLLVLPNKRFTFDHRRPVTSIEHMIADFEAGTEEADLTHLPEILAMHDFQRDPDAGDHVDFRNRCMHNITNRCMHHHVFDIPLAICLFQYLGLTVLAAEELAPHHILVLAQKGRQL